MFPIFLLGKECLYLDLIDSPKYVELFVRIRQSRFSLVSKLFGISEAIMRSAFRITELLAPTPQAIHGPEMKSSCSAIVLTRSLLLKKLFQLSEMSPEKILASV